MCNTILKSFLSKPIYKLGLTARLSEDNLRGEKIGYQNMSFLSRAGKGTLWTPIVFLPYALAR